MNRFLRILLIFLILIFLFNYKKILSYFAFPQTYKIVKTTEEIFIRKDGIVLFNEEIVFSPYNGKIEFHYSNGEKIKKNSHIASISTENGEFKIYSSSVGILSLKFDDFNLSENYFDENILKNLKNKKDHRIIKDGDEVKIGQPIFKIIDNLYSFVIFENDNEIESFIKENFIYLKNLYNGETFKGEIVENNKEFLKIKIDRFIEYFIDERIHPFEILLYEGEVIKIKESFVKNGGFDLKEDFKTRFVSIENLKYIKNGGYLIFPLFEENKPLFDLIGKEIIK